jgi:hypothetical protein
LLLIHCTTPIQYRFTPLKRQQKCIVFKDGILMNYFLFTGLPHNEVLPRLKEKVLDFKQSMPVVTSLRNPSLRARHWEVIEKIIGKVIVRDKGFTLGDLLAMNVSFPSSAVCEANMT